MQIDLDALEEIQKEIEELKALLDEYTLSSHEKYKDGSSAKFKKENSQYVV